MDDTKPKLYHFPGSLCSQKVRLALAEKQVAYDVQIVEIELKMENYEPWYVELNPRAVVPTLVHGDQPITDSSNIIRYIDETFDGPGLLPSDTLARSRVESWIAAQDHLGLRELSYHSFAGVLGFVLRRISMPRRVTRLERLKRKHQALAPLYESKLEDIRDWRAAIGSDAHIDEIRRHLEQVLDEAESQLQCSKYLAADEYSLADIAWTCVLARLSMLDLAKTLWGEGKRPQLAAYYESLRKRPSFVSAQIWEETPVDRIKRAIGSRRFARA